jgi:predicted transposase/invertase (TIGR01784 family)
MIQVLNDNIDRDLKNSFDYAKEEGKIEGKIEGKMEIAQQMLKDGLPIETICKYTGLLKEQLLAEKNTKKL